MEPFKFSAQVQRIKKINPRKIYYTSRNGRKPQKILISQETKLILGDRICESKA